MEQITEYIDFHRLFRFRGGRGTGDRIDGVDFPAWADGCKKGLDRECFLAGVLIGGILGFVRGWRPAAAGRYGGCREGLGREKLIGFGGVSNAFRCWEIGGGEGGGYTGGGGYIGGRQQAVSRLLL